MVESAVHTTWVLLVVFGVLGMHLRQENAAGVFGQIATLVALFGTVTHVLDTAVLFDAVPGGSAIWDSPRWTRTSLWRPGRGRRTGAHEVV
jgi:hypothetical protein